MLEVRVVVREVERQVISVAIFFFFNDPPTAEIYTLSLHDALPIFVLGGARGLAVLDDRRLRRRAAHVERDHRSEEHTSELQSHSDLVCRLLLEKKKSVK